jgi:hypothetical protein
MKVYVSGKFSRWKEINAYVEDLKRTVRCELAWDWTLHENRILPMDLAAVNDARGSLDCNLHLVIIDDPDHPYRGTWCEMGISLASVLNGDSNKKIVICNLTNNKFDDFPFYHHPMIAKCFTWENTKQHIFETLFEPRLATKEDQQ